MIQEKLTRPAILAGTLRERWQLSEQWESEASPETGKDCRCGEPADYLVTLEGAGGDMFAWSQFAQSMCSGCYLEYRRENAPVGFAGCHRIEGILEMIPAAAREILGNLWEEVTPDDLAPNTVRALLDDALAPLLAFLDCPQRVQSGKPYWESVAELIEGEYRRYMVETMPYAPMGQWDSQSEHLEVIATALPWR